MLAENNKCEVRETGCQIIATGLHHKVKRTEKNLCDVNNLLRACNSCQLWIEMNPVSAVQKGYSISKHLN